MPEPGVPARIWVVGCPRSGTTLVQSMLGAHPAVLAFPETHALRELEPTDPLRRRLGLRSDRGAETWSALPGCGVPVSGDAPRRVRPYVRAVVAAMDAAARHAGRTAWSEKTPGHLRSLHLVAAHAPGSQVVHIVRRGVPAITSLRAVTLEHGESWDGERSIGLCITRWRNDLRRTAAWSGTAGHHVLSYESLVDEPEATLGRLTTRLGLGAESGQVEAMITGYHRSAETVTVADEVWKREVGAPLQNRNASRPDVLTAAEGRLVERSVAECEDVYRALPLL